MPPGGGSAISRRGRLGDPGASSKLPVVEVYGMTETSSVHTLAYPSRPIRLGSVGLPMPYARVRIVQLDADGRLIRDCAPDEIGVVIMAGPGVFGGYLNDAHNKGAFVDEVWVNSGDLGRLDADGYLWITGRAKDLVIRGGHNIDPAPIEEIMFRHPAVGFAAVVGQPDAYAGELPVGYVQLKPGATVEPGELEALGARAHAGARRRPGAGHPDRSDAGDRRRQGVQAAAALGRRPARVHQGAGAARRARHRLQGQGRCPWQPRIDRDRDASPACRRISARWLRARCTRCLHRS